MAGLQSLWREELDYRGIYLLDIAITFLSWDNSGSVVPHSLKQVQPVPETQCCLATLFRGLSFHLLTQLSKSTPSLIHNKPQNLNSSKVHLVCMKQLWEGDWFSLIKDIHMCLEGNLKKRSTSSRPIRHAHDMWATGSSPHLGHQEGEQEADALAGDSRTSTPPRS